MSKAGWQGWHPGRTSISFFDSWSPLPAEPATIACSPLFSPSLLPLDLLFLIILQNRMRESFFLFESVINSRWFFRTPVILFLNKIDVFKTKLPRVRCVVLYSSILPSLFFCHWHSTRSTISLTLRPCRSPSSATSPSTRAEMTCRRQQSISCGSLCKRIEQGCRCIHSECRPHHHTPHAGIQVGLPADSVTQATNTKNIHLVCAAVKETIMQNAPQDVQQGVQQNVLEKIKRNLRTRKYTEIL